MPEVSISIDISLQKIKSKNTYGCIVESSVLYSYVNFTKEILC